jgi:hypothetical protein
MSMSMSSLCLCQSMFVSICVSISVSLCVCQCLVCLCAASNKPHLIWRRVYAVKYSILKPLKKLLSLLHVSFMWRVGNNRQLCRSFTTNANKTVTEVLFCEKCCVGGGVYFCGQQHPAPPAPGPDPPTNKCMYRCFFKIFIYMFTMFVLLI